MGRTWKSRCWDALQHRLFHGGASWGRVSRGPHRPGRAGAGMRSSTACFTAVQVGGESRVGRTWKSRCWDALQHRLFHGGARRGRVSRGQHRPGRAGAGMRSSTACFTAVQVRGGFRVGRTGLEEPVLGSAPTSPVSRRCKSGGESRMGRTGLEEPVLGSAPAPPVSRRCKSGGESRMGRTGLEEPVLENAAGQVCRPASRKRLIKPWRRLYWSRIWLTCSSKADCRFWYSARCSSFFNSPTASS